VRLRVFVKSPKHIFSPRSQPLGDDAPLKPIALAKLKHKSVAEIRAEGPKVHIPREIADMYADLTQDSEKMVAAMWQLLLEYVSRQG